MEIINDRYKRKESESNFEYGLRLIEIKCEENPQDLDWQSIVDYLNLNIHRDSLRKACNTTEFSAYNVMKYYKNKLLEDKIDNKDILKEIDEKMKDFEKEKIRFQDQKREYRNYLRVDARFEHLLKTMQNEIKELSKVKPISTNKYPINQGNNHAVAIFSDWHTGINEENYWNKISVEILKDRVEKLQNKIIEICNIHKVSTLHIEILGDMVNGLIHTTTRISNEEDVIKQTMICAEILSNVITNLSSEIPNIKIYSATGNHGRCVANAKDSLDTENFEKLIPWYLQTRLKDLDNVEFCNNEYDDNIITYRFLNETIFAVHGHQDKIDRVVDNLSSMLKIFPTELHMGHYHSYYEKDNHDVSTIVNGTASGVDKYAKSIRKTGKATQVCAVYNSEGRECTYKIKLN